MRTVSEPTHVDVSLVDLVHDDVADASDSSFQLPQQDTCRRHASLLVATEELVTPVLLCYFKMIKLVASYPIKNVIEVPLSVLVV